MTSASTLPSTAAVKSGTEERSSMQPPPTRPPMTQGTQQQLRDDFGFAVPAPYSSLYRDFRLVHAAEESNRLESWGRWLEPYSGRVEVALTFAIGMGSAREEKRVAAESSPELAQRELGFLIKAGVPKAYREAVWKAFLVPEEGQNGGDDVDGNHSESPSRSRGLYAAYAELVSQMDAPEFRDDMDQIEKDLHRTFPNHRLTSDAKGKARLRRVLGAYAVRNPLVGYCQGLNFLAATCLLVFCYSHGEDGGGGDGREAERESTAFWCFVALVEDILTGYFDPMMINQQVDGLVFEQLVREILPDLAGHFDEVGVHVPTAVAGWFLVAFVNTLPAEATMRVWDILFFEKSPAVLFRVGLGLLDVYKEAILECRNDSDAYMLLQAIGGITFDASSLVEAMGSFAHVTGSVLKVLRGRYAPGVAKVMEKMYVSGGGGTGRGLSSGQSSVSETASSQSRGSSSGLDRYVGQHSANGAFVTNAMSTDIEKRLGILRLRHKDPQMSHDGGDGGTSHALHHFYHQDSLRRTQSALNDTTSGIVLQGRNERLQQQLRINLLAMRTFVPDMKLLKTALMIASGNRDVSGAVGIDHGVADDMKSTSNAAGGANANANSNSTSGQNNSKTPVPRRFTDGGALLSSPFKGTGMTAATTVTATPTALHNTVSTTLPSAAIPTIASINALPLEKLKNIESMKSALSVEVSNSVELLEQISSTNLQLENTVAEISDQLLKVQQEIEHKVSTYDVLSNRANELHEQSKRVELEYRKQLTANIKLAESWRTISKDIKKNDNALKMLMDLAESRSAGTDVSQPESPTKKLRSKVVTMIGRKFTR